MFERILSVIFPIFAIVACGFVYARFKKPDMAFANQLNMDIFVPAIVFAAMASKSFDIGQYWVLALGALAVVLGSGLLALPLARLMGVQAKTLVPPMMFTNSGNMGLPLALLAFGENALPAAVMLFFVENTTHYVLGTWVLDQQAKLTTLWKEPVIAAAIAGLVVSLLKISIWPPLLFAIKMTGDVSIPLLLFSLGVRLTQSKFSDMRVGVVGAVFCPLVGMAIAWLMTQYLPLSDAHKAMLIVFGALPPAVLNFVFAERYQQEPERVASLVMIGNMASLIFIPLALAWVL